MFLVHMTTYFMYGNVIYAHILHLFMGLYCLPDFPYKKSDFFSLHVV